MFSVTRTYKIWFTISALLMAVSIFLFAIWGLRPGIDFLGGVLFQGEFQVDVDPAQMHSELAAAGFEGALIQPVSGNSVLIKTKALSETELARFKTVLSEKFGQYQEQKFESIGPVIGKELVRKAYLQIALVIAGIVLYVSYAFRKIRRQSSQSKLTSWKMGTATIVALIHDLVITVGVFVVLGKYRGVEVDGLFVTALLTILGFSVHDTIVVFDRIREAIHEHPNKSLGTLVDYSVASTLARSINTSSTVIFVLLAMLLFGGESVRYFVLALLAGITIGTYSSIFIASPILYLWQRKSS